MAKKKLVNNGPRKDHFTHPGVGKITMVQPTYLTGSLLSGNNMTNCSGMTDGWGSPIAGGNGSGMTY